MLAGSPFTKLTQSAGPPCFFWTAEVLSNYNIILLQIIICRREKGKKEKIENKKENNLRKTEGED